MVEMPEIFPTVQKIYKAYQDRPNDWRRDHLGASSIGHACERKLWFDFRWCSKPGFEGRTLRLFETGKREEIRVIENLREIKVTVWAVDPNTGLQITYGSFGGHYGGSLDGMIFGVDEAPETWHVLEVKTMNTRDFNRMKKEGVKKVKFLYYCQMQAYMHWSEVERAYFLCVCKETDEIYPERVYYDKKFAEGLELKAKRIVFSPTPLFKISDDPDLLPECHFCDHKKLCQGQCLPLVTCRTCAWVTPHEDGFWVCDRTEEKISSSGQRHPCEFHIFVPDLVPLEMVNADADVGTVTYKLAEGSISNGPGAIASGNLGEYIWGKKKVSPALESGAGKCLGNHDRDSGRPYAPEEPDGSGVVYDTEYMGQ